MIEQALRNGSGGLRKEPGWTVDPHDAEPTVWLLHFKTVTDTWDMDLSNVAQGTSDKSSSRWI